MSRRPLPLRFLTLGALLVLVPTAAMRVQGQAGPAAQNRVVALRGGTWLTVTRGTIANGTVLLRDGKIAAVGANVSIPAGADIVDTTGQFVTPGLIDAHSHIANDAINEGGTTVSSMTGMEDVLDATDINGVAEVMLANESTFAGGVWVSMRTLYDDWVLTPGDGQKTVYARFRDNAGNVSERSDLITVDTQGPSVSIVLAGGAAAILRGDGPARRPQRQAPSPPVGAGLLGGRPSAASSHPADDLQPPHQARRVNPIVRA